MILKKIAYHKYMDSSEIRKKFLDFFEKRKHKIVSSSSLIPDDPSVLLTTAGMQQFKKYYTGEADPIKDFGTKNTASIQKSFRTSDIDEVGDDSHLTFFEMLGNFSFGGYFKEEAIKHAYDFFREVGLPIDFVTIFGGDKEVPPDIESEEIWKRLGVKDVRRHGREDNFWGPTGSEGPCGPTTELYVQGVEIWNLVFNEYYCRADKTLEKLKQNGVDTGMGLERLAMVLQKKNNIFETDLFGPFIDTLPTYLSDQTKRIIVDHARAIIFLIGDELVSSNKDAGYVLRRIARRYIVRARGVSDGYYTLLGKLIEYYKDVYLELDKEKIFSVFKTELSKFEKTLNAGLHELEKAAFLDGSTAFRLYESYGLPFEIIKDLGGEKAKVLTREAFDKEFKKHQEISRAGQEKKFGGHGLILDTGELKAGDSEELKKVTRLHTATHLLNAALRKVLSPDIQQQGSDITAERTRFDFQFPRKLTVEEVKKIEEWVNELISRKLEVKFEELLYEEAMKSGALRFWREKYLPAVKIYTIHNPATGEVFSREFCGGPHVKNTSEIGHFKITKEESSSAGVRRIRAMVY